MALSDLHTSVDWGGLAPLRFRARAIAEGAYAGSHRSTRWGGGVEFGGHREYTPGDDLRRLDRRSLLRHGHLLVRQFETETERPLFLVVDATASMNYRGSAALGAKFAWAAVIAASLGLIAVRGGDPLALHFIGGGPDVRSLPRAGGYEAFERLVTTLERSITHGDTRRDPSLFLRTIDDVARRTRRGSIVVILSDLLDLPDDAADRIAVLSSMGRVVVVVQVLDPDEATFPFDGAVRLKSLEGEDIVETDAATARPQYLERLAALSAGWELTLNRRGARLVEALTSEEPMPIVRQIVEKMRPLKGEMLRA